MIRIRLRRGRGVPRERPKERAATAPSLPPRRRPTAEEVRAALALREELRPALLNPDDVPSSGIAEREPARREVDPEDVPRYTGTVHWMHKSIPVLEIHGRDNPVLSPEEIARMRRR